MAEGPFVLILIAALSGCGAEHASTSGRSPDRAEAARTTTTASPSNEPGSGCESPELEVVNIDRATPDEALHVTARMRDNRGAPIARAVLRIYLEGSPGFESDGVTSRDGSLRLTVSPEAIAFADASRTDFTSRFVLSFEGSYEAGGRDEGGAVGTVFCDAEVAGQIPHV